MLISQSKQHKQKEKLCKFPASFKITEIFIGVIQEVLCMSILILILLAMTNVL